MAKVQLTQRLTARILAVLTAKEILRARIRALLQLRSISQVELAKSMGRSPSWMTQVLNGTIAPSFDALDHLARALNVEIPDLFMDRDLARHARLLQNQVSPDALKGANLATSSAVPFSRDVLEAYAAISGFLFDHAVAQTTAPTPAPETQKPVRSLRHRQAGRPRAPRMK
jgi:transcriptional regulator with XRE-family HTH domain